jgi:hypothetical protein
MYAVTEWVWVFDSHFPHVRPESISDAVLALADGKTVVMDSLEDARAVLIAVGSPPEDADYRIRQTQKRIDAGIHD